MTAAGGADGCRELRREIYRLHDEVVAFYKRVEQITGEEDLAVANEFRYVLRLFLDADKRAQGVINDGGEEELLMQARYQLLILHHDTIDFVEARFRKKFFRMLHEWGGKIVGRHVNIREFHRDLSAAEDIIAKSREARDDRHRLYREMAKEGGIAEKMVHHLKTLSAAEPHIRADVRQEARDDIRRNPWVVAIISGLAVAAFVQAVNSWGHKLVALFEFALK